MIYLLYQFGIYFLLYIILINLLLFNYYFITIKLNI